MFFEIGALDIASYAEDNTPFIFSSELNEVLQKLRIEVNKMPKWFQNNYFKLNPKECHLLATSKSEMTLKFVYCYLIWIFHSINKKN